MKDQERFEYELNLVPAGAQVTEEDLEADGASFMAFAAAFGITPPTGGTSRAPADPVPSPASP